MTNIIETFKDTKVYNGKIRAVDDLNSKLKGEKMNSYRKTAIIVGVLFITATVTSILSTVFLGSTLAAPNYLTSVSANENQVIIAVIFELIAAGSFSDLCYHMKRNSPLQGHYE